MPHPRNPGFRAGENWQCCPVCGFEYRASDFKRRWDGLMVCYEDYEERHPQDFVRAKVDDMRPAVSTGCSHVIQPDSRHGLLLFEDSPYLLLSESEPQLLLEESS